MLLFLIRKGKKMKKISVLLLCMLFISAPPSAAASESFTNGDFSVIAEGGLMPASWNIGYGSIAVPGTNIEVLKEQFGAKNAVRMYDPNNTGTAHYKHVSIGQSLTGLTPGAEYTITGYSKLVTKGTSQGGVIKVTCGGKEHDITAYYSKIGVWEKQSIRFVVPDSASSASVLIRLVGGGELLWADMQVSRTKTYVASFETDEIFYYQDQAEGTATVRLNQNLSAAYAGGKVTFFIKDGESVLWHSDATLSAGTAKASFPLRYLSTKKKAYTAEVSVKDASGNELEKQSLRVYRYDRPSMISADGKITVNGKEIKPVFAYHVRKKHYKACAAAGINIVQNAKHSTVQGYIDMLDDALDENGKPIVHMILPLYNSMKPAGHPANIELTRAVAQSETVRNHPAFFGYLVMDEPFLNMEYPEEHLERAYTSIREYDDVHPIFIMENYSEKYSTTVKYTDILGPDIYVAGATAENPVSEYVSYHASIGSEAAGDKPFWVLLQTFDYVNYFPTATELHGQMYQAAFAGADALGFYKIEKASGGKDLNNIPEIWNMISGVCAGEEYTQLIKKETFVSSDSDAYLARRWESGNNKYVQVLNRTMEVQTMEVPLGSLAAGLYDAEVLWGDTSDAQVDLKRGVLRLKLPAAGAATVKLTYEAADCYVVDSGTGVAVESVSGGQKVDVVLHADALGLTESTLQLVTAFYAGGAVPELSDMQFYQVQNEETVHITGVTVPTGAEDMQLYLWPSAARFKRLFKTK